MPNHLLTCLYVCVSTMRSSHALFPAETPFLEVRQGSVRTCAYLSILDIAVQRQNLLLLTLQAGKAAFEGLALQSTSPAQTCCSYPHAMQTARGVARDKKDRAGAQDNLMVLCS